MSQLAPINFPYLITRACTALPYIEEFQKLPDGFLRVALRVIQKIDLKTPFKAIFASRGTLAHESGKSLDIVHRAIKWMVDNEFLERERKAQPGNRGSSSPLVPTLRLLQCLCLVDAQGAPLVEMRTSTPITKEVDSCAETSTQAVAFQPTLASEPALVPASSDRAGRSGFQRIGSVLVPKDLAWLCEQGVSAFGVLGLMKAARGAKQTLSDVLTAARKYLEGLNAREIYAYLSKLIKSGKDFSGIAKETHEIEKIEEISQFLQNKLEEMEGCSYVSRKHNRVYKVMEGVLYEMRENASWTVHMISQKFIDAIHEGRLVPHRG